SSAAGTDIKGGRGNKVSFVLGDARSLPFVSENFDAVISIKLLSHFKETEPYLSEMSRVLKPKGQLILDAPHPLAASAVRVLRNPSIQSYLDYFHPFSEIARVFRKH